MKRFWLPLLIGIVISVPGCANQQNTQSQTAQEQTSKEEAAAKQSAQSSQAQESAEQTSQEASKESGKEQESGTVMFTDSIGREVEIPENIEKIAPSGYLAQIMLYSVAPDKMVGWGSKPKEEQMKYIAEKYAEKPEFGAFYGKNANLNMEALIAAGPELVIDLGEPKDDIKEGMDTIQTQTGIPTVFIEATFEKLPEAYITLGKILGEEEQANKLSQYCKEALDLARSNAQKVTTKPKVFYAEGENGLTTIGAESIHSETIEFLGAENVAKLEKGSKSGAEVSMEQLINWAPDVIITADEKVYELILSDAAWSSLEAVKNKKVYLAPSLPYNWVGRPPSVNRILGMQWLGSLLFPEEYPYDMVEQAREFYQLFYHYELSEEEAKEMLKNSIFKE